MPAAGRFIFEVVGDIMLKPLSQKTLEKKYAELGLSKEKVALLHQYFLCFSNLYGVISILDAWDVFKHYEGINCVRKNDFIAFSGIAQREAGHPYSVFDLKELYTEEADDPAERMIVNNRLVVSGYYRFVYLYPTVEHQADKPYYLPPKKEDFFSFTEDRFYSTPAGRQMKTFIESLITSGIEKDFDGRPCSTIYDLDGKPVAGKRLSKFVFYTSSERSDIEYVKSEVKKQRLREEYRITAAEKLLNRIHLFLMSGGVFANQDFSYEMVLLASIMDGEFGVSLSDKQFERFTDLFVQLNNRSHLWLNCGWSPDDLFRRTPRTKPETMSFGKNMKKMFADGTLDRTSIEKMLAEMGVKVLN